MHRKIVYPGQIPLDSDLLDAQRFAMSGLARFTEAVMGSGSIAAGLAVIPTVPASLAVQVTPGSIMALAALDQTDFGSLLADISTQIVKQGLLETTTLLTVVPPTTLGTATNYLIQAAFSETDADPLLLPYYNPDNPAQPYSGPNNAGTDNFTVRRARCVVSAKAGAPAPAGTQVTPAPDAGYIPLAVVTVAQGATQITSAQIVVPDVNGYVPVPLPQVPAGVQDGRWVYAVDTGAANAYVAKVSPPVGALRPGMGVRLRIGASNTGAATFNLCGTGAQAIRRANGAALQADDLRANQVADLIWDGAAWQIANFQGITSATTNNNTYVLDLPYAVDSGTPNAVVATFSPAISALVGGALLKIKIANTNTGAATVQVNALAPVEAIRPNGSPLQAGDLLGGAETLWIYDGAKLQLLTTPSAAVVLPGYQDGQKLVRTGATTLQVTAGVVAAVSRDAMLTLPVALTKNVAANWVAGASSGALDAGTLAASTWYDVRTIGKPDGTTDVLVTLAGAAPTLPVGYTRHRLRGSFKTDASGNITPFIQVGHDFMWATPVKDVYVPSGPISEGETLRALRVPPSRRVKAYGSMLFGWCSQGTGIYVSSPDQSAIEIYENPGAASNLVNGVPGMINVAEGSADGELASGTYDVVTDAAQQVRTQLRSAGGDHQYSGSSTVFIMSTIRWTELEI